MSTTSISTILKQQRNTHNFTPEQVVSMLSERGISISTKALYAYEAGINLPKVPVFLALCDIYEIRDIMHSFGYKASLCLGNNEWHKDQYDDFFKATLYEKIFLLAKWGIPSFDGYESILMQKTPFALSDEEWKMIESYRNADEIDRRSVLRTLRIEPSETKAPQSNVG